MGDNYSYDNHDKKISMGMKLSITNKRNLTLVIQL